MTTRPPTKYEQIRVTQPGHTDRNYLNDQQKRLEDSGMTGYSFPLAFHDMVLEAAERCDTREAINRLRAMVVSTEHDVQNFGLRSDTTAAQRRDVFTAIDNLQRAAVVDLVESLIRGCGCKNTASAPPKTGIMDASGVWH